MLALAIHSAALGSPVGLGGDSDQGHLHKSAIRLAQQQAHTPERSPFGDIRCGMVIPDIEPRFGFISISIA